MARIQRRLIVGQEYRIRNANATGERRVVYAGPAKIDGREHWIFRPMRKASKMNTK
jgi:hypothetical protein